MRNLVLQQSKEGRKPFKRTYRRLTKISLIVLVIISILGGSAFFIYHQIIGYSSPTFFASVDTMKVSRDTARQPLSKQEITKIVDMYASLNTNYITVDTQWDYPDYMAQWINAIRLTKRHVWFRILPNQWENNNGSIGIMTPTQYLASEQKFILTHPSFFQADDILDPCSEAEQGLYWKASYGEGWTSNAPNAATSEYNLFLRQTTDVADAALHQRNISRVITTVRSINSFFATHPGVLERATVEKFGIITIDSYPDQDTLDPDAAVRARIDELNHIESLWHVPIVIGEMGYSNNIPVSDTIQRTVLKAEFSQLQLLPYLKGVNYWVGVGSNTAGGYTYIITRRNGAWIVRPAAYELAAFYDVMLTRAKNDWFNILP